MRQSREGNDKKYKVRLVTETFAHIAVGIISIASVFISLMIPKGCRALKVGWVFFFLRFVDSVLVSVFVFILLLCFLT